MTWRRWFRRLWRRIAGRADPRRPEEPPVTYIGWGLALLAATGALLAALALSVADARAADPRYCALWAIVRTGTVARFPDGAGDYSDPAVLHALMDRAFYSCLAQEADGLALPPGGSDTEAWAAFFARHSAARQGTVPAVDPAEAAEPEWRVRCRKNYRSYRASDDTVIRRGHRSRRTDCPGKPAEEATP